MTLTLDHLVICATTLEEGRAWAETRLGTSPGGQGRHATMGTHNALWGLGASYLEVIAIDPDGTPPDGPRWFGLDDPALQSRLAEGPVLASWAVAVDDLSAVPAPLPLETLALARDDLTWEVALPRIAPLPLGGAWPLLIRWTSGLHPAARLGEQGLSLIRLEIAGHGAEETRDALGRVAETAPVVFAPDDGPTRLSASLDTPNGPVAL